MRACYGFVLAFAACGYGPTSSTTTTTTPSSSSSTASAGNHDRELIEKAYAAKDVKSLHELLDIISDKTNHTVARDYYIKLQLDALVALDCDPFFAAFEPVRGKANPRTAFASLTSELDDKKKQYVAAEVLQTAARCRSPQIFMPGLHRIVPDSEDVWAAALVAVDKRGLPVYDVFMTALRGSTKHMDGKLVSKWLVATKEPFYCHELATASKTAEPDIRAGLEEFYTQKGCKAELSASR